MAAVGRAEHVEDSASGVLYFASASAIGFIRQSACSAPGQCLPSFINLGLITMLPNFAVTSSTEKLPRGTAALRLVAMTAGLFISLLWAPAVLASAVAGSVTFVSGSATQTLDARTTPLSKGSEVYVGARLATGEDGYVHLRMVDGAVLSLRSQSELGIEHYHYAPDAPSESRVNLVLHAGVVRSISGEVGARSRERFRLDTPVAAIGIRGTDFNVLANPEVSRLSLNRGGVVMSPFSAGCRPGGTGACAGNGAATLLEDQPGLLLESRRGALKAHLTRTGVTPNEYRPPHPSEAMLQPGGAMPGAPSSAGWGIRGESLPGAESYEEALEQAEDYMAQTGLIAEAVERGNQAGEIQPEDRGLVENPTILWGRWSSYGDSEAPSVAKLLHGDAQPRHYAVINSVFGMVENNVDKRRMPDTGKAYFNLNRHETYIKRGNALEAAAITHPGLVVDFEQQRFAARVDVHADSLSGPVPVVGGGKLTRDGIMHSDGRSPSEMAGVISKDTGEAGLLFEYQIEPGVEAVGATHWTRDRDSANENR